MPTTTLATISNTMKRLMQLSLLICLPCAHAQSYSLPNNGNVVRYEENIPLRHGDTLELISQRAKASVEELQAANPALQGGRRLSVGKSIVVPRYLVLPGAVRSGIVINLPERRLYLYVPGKREVIVEPVGIGRIGWETPIGETTIIDKRKNPQWRPPEAVREEAKRSGRELTDIVPPGPDNPLGKYMMRLGWRSYLIHSTNEPEGVGQRVTAGCIRMNPEAIEAIFPLVRVGTRVTIINQPIKVGRLENRFFLEVHPPLAEQGELLPEDTTKAVRTLTQLITNKAGQVSWALFQDTLKRQQGVPVYVGYQENQAVEVAQSDQN